MGQLIELVLVFFKIGLFSIGGGYAIIPLIQAQVVEHYGWISQKTFTDIITISQMTPGPLAVNTSTFIGIQIAGIAGAVLATAGCVISGILISLLLYRFFKKHRESDYIFQVLNGLKASSLGLIVSAAVTILLLAFTGSGELSGDMRMDWIAAVVFAGSFFALRKWKVNPILMIVVTGVIGGVLY
ncbi:MAG TPA: chromate transporter [Candidatus Blautia faecigallinarum]|uniref:Chromate transporter n=1 Tax=Candidatus Blautia faecigallinarum TaxID=2838488 RepID=A0A9D2DSN2_9FIRM|nr:chromate transporter [Candidatus Blautia faecigallinarum]